MTPIHSHQEMYIRDLNFEFEKLESTEVVGSAQAATATLYNDWLGVKSVDSSVQKSLNLFYSKKQLEKKSGGAFLKYHEQGEPKEE